jgi:hypothetical protein
MITQYRVETCCPNSTLSKKYKVCLTDKDHFIEYQVCYAVQGHTRLPEVNSDRYWKETTKGKT